VLFYVLFVSIVLFYVLFVSIVLFYVLFVSTVLFYVLFVSIVLFYILFVCKCVLYYCHQVATQLKLDISYHISSISYHISHNIISYHISYHIMYFFTFQWSDISSFIGHAHIKEHRACSSFSPHMICCKQQMLNVLKCTAEMIRHDLLTANANHLTLHHLVSTSPVDAGYVT